MRFDLLRRKAESSMQMGGTCPGVRASARCVQNASLCRPETPPELASVHGNLGISAAARQMLQLVGPRGGAVRQDVLDVSSDNDDFAASVAYRVAKKRKGEKDEDGGDEGGKGEGGRSDS